MRGDCDKGLLSGFRLCGDMLEPRSKRLALVLLDENTPLPPVILPTPLLPRNAAAAAPCKLLQKHCRYYIHDNYWPCNTMKKLGSFMNKRYKVNLIFTK